MTSLVSMARIKEGSKPTSPAKKWRYLFWCPFYVTCRLFLHDLCIQRFCQVCKTECKLHTANILLSKLISGPRVYFTDSVGEPQCQDQDAEFPLWKASSSFFTCFSVNTETEREDRWRVIRRRLGRSSNLYPGYVCKAIALYYEKRTHPMIVEKDANIFTQSWVWHWWKDKAFFRPPPSECCESQDTQCGKRFLCQHQRGREITQQFQPSGGTYQRWHCVELQKQISESSFSPHSFI